MATGIALSVKANLGVSPISCVPYIYSLKLPLTIGEITILLNVIFITGQIILLRSKFHFLQLTQLLAAIIFGYFIDLALYLISNLAPSSYLWQVFWCFLSCMVLAFGVFLVVNAHVIYLPGVGLTVAIAETFHKEVGKVKVGIDGSMVLIGVVSSFVLLHQLKGIGEGTIIAALLVGSFVNLYSNKLKRISLWLNSEQPPQTH